MRVGSKSFYIILIAIFVVVFSMSSCKVEESISSGLPEQPAIPEQPVPTSDESKTLHSAKVDRVVDGDTLKIIFEGNSERVRLIGVDTPESVAPDKDRNVPYGKIASEFTKEKLDGKDIELEFDVKERDSYGRLLAYVYLDGVMFNKTLLDEGHAQIYTFPPNVKYVDLFEEAQKAAREAGKGIWNNDNYDFKYVGSTSSHKFHTMDCEGGQSISEKNAKYFTNRDEAIDTGFEPSKDCNP
jgi:Micrococcal nuclease (thermonuclease) homologs